jgi:hypothetical protein
LTMILWAVTEPVKKINTIEILTSAVTGCKLMVHCLTRR